MKCTKAVLSLVAGVCGLGIGAPGFSSVAEYNDQTRVDPREVQIEGVADLVFRTSLEGPGWILIVRSEGSERGLVYELEEVFAQGSTEAPILVRVGQEYVAPGSRLRLDADIERVSADLARFSRPRNVMILARTHGSGGSTEAPLFRCDNSVGGASSNLTLDIEVQKLSRFDRGYKVSAAAYNSKGSLSERLESSNVELRLAERKMVLEARGEQGRVELELDRLDSAIRARGQVRMSVHQGPSIEQDIACAPAL